MGYKRYSDTKIFTVDNSEATTGVLKKTTDKYIYFGIAKPKGSNNFRNLNQTDLDKGIQSDTEGCSGTITYTSSKSNVGIINYALSANTTNADRTIIFKYNNIELFQILQKYNGDNLIYESDNIYVCIIPQMSTSADKAYLFVGLQDYRPNQAQLDANNYKTMAGTKGFNTTYSGSGKMLYFSNIILPENKTIKELKDSGLLTVIRENNAFISTSDYNNQKPYHIEKVNTPATLNGLYDFSDDSKKSDAFKGEYSMYATAQDGTGLVYGSIRFNIFNNSYYYGVYKYNNMSNYIYIIKFYTSKTSGLIKNTGTIGNYIEGISQTQGGSWYTKTNGYILWYYSNNITIKNINQSIKTLISNGILEPVESTNTQLNNSNYILYKVSNEYNKAVDSETIYVSFNDNIYIYEDSSETQSDSVKCIAKINFSKLAESYHMGIFKYNSDKDKVTYTISLYRIDKSSVTSETGYKQYIFNMENNAFTDFTDSSSTSKYKNLPFKKEPSSSTYSYLLWETSNTLLYDSFKPETISNLKTKYNLKSKTNAQDINYLYGKYVMNVTGNTICRRGRSGRYNWSETLINYIFELKDGETEFKMKSKIELVGSFTIEV